MTRKDIIMSIHTYLKGEELFVGVHDTTHQHLLDAINVPFGGVPNRGGCHLVELDV